MNSTNVGPILFIARVFPNITINRIHGIIKALKIGKIDKVDIKAWKNKEGKSFNKLFIHLIWNTDEETQSIIKRLNDGKEIKIVYDDPWFWKVAAYKNTDNVRKNNTKPLRPRAKIEIPSDDETYTSGLLLRRPESCANSPLKNDIHTPPAPREKQKYDLNEDDIYSPTRYIDEANNYNDLSPIDYGGSQAIPKKKSKKVKI
jgi:hypothetical protein